MASRFVFVPVGGLANRMRAISSAIEFAQKNERTIEIIWFQDYGMGAPFYKLFQPMNIAGVTIRDANFIDYFLYDRPRKKNFFIPCIFQSLLFNKRIYENSFDFLLKSSFNFNSLSKHQRLFMASFYAFYPVVHPFKIFNPLSEIQGKIEQIISSFSSRTIGVHIRRTDNIESIVNSPLSLFITKMQAAIDENPQTDFYLATDSNEVKEELIRKFPNKIKTTNLVLRRDSLEGIQNAVVELYVLSNTKEIWGSFNSSFSETSAQISNIKYTAIIKKN